jgi:Flp pilus assembly pilin Flp
MILSDQAVHDQAGATHVEPGILVTARAVRQVQHRVALAAGFVPAGV